jgi:hypothetical protein
MPKIIYSNLPQIFYSISSFSPASRSPVPLPSILEPIWHLCLCEGCPLGQFLLLLWRWIRITAVGVAQNGPGAFLFGTIKKGGVPFGTKTSSQPWNSSWSLRHPKLCGATGICAGFDICQRRPTLYYILDYWQINFGWGSTHFTATDLLSLQLRKVEIFCWK